MNIDRKKLVKILKPFANMHRPTDDKWEQKEDDDKMLLKRGVGGDATFLFGEDIRKAYEFFKKLV